MNWNERQGGVVQPTPPPLRSHVIRNHKYPIIHFSDGSCLCTTKLSVYAEFPPNSTKTAWAKFTAPSAAVKKVSILFPGGEPIDDVPITDKDGSGTLVKDRNTGSPPSPSKATHPRSGKTSL